MSSLSLDVGSLPNEKTGFETIDEDTVVVVVIVVVVVVVMVSVLVLVSVIVVARLIDDDNVVGVAGDAVAAVELALQKRNERTSIR